VVVFKSSRKRARGYRGGAGCKKPKITACNLEGEGKRMREVSGIKYCNVSPLEKGGGRGMRQSPTTSGELISAARCLQGEIRGDRRAELS